MEGPSFRFDGFELDTAQFELRSGDLRISLEPRAFDVLRYLLTNRGRVVSTEELLDTLWGDRFVGEAALTTAIRTARIAIGDSGKEQRLIRTVVRRGYQFVGTVAETGSAAGPASANRMPLPARLIESSGLGFAGRDTELTMLRDACKEVIANGQRQLVFVSGEAGIGKTTLCSVVAAAAHHEGAAVLYGRCDDDLSIPYQPWRHVLSTLAQQLPDVVADRHEALAPLLGGTSIADVDSDAARFSLYGSVIETLDAVSDSGQLTLVVLDDLHWADAQTIALLRHFVQRTLTTPVLVVATFRDTDIDATHPLTDLLATAHREPGTTRLQLNQLDDDEVLALLENLAGHEMDTDGLELRDALRSETEGNPFFVTEILRHLTETGAIRQDGNGRWATPTDLGKHGLPISVREVVSRRIERLGPETRRALDAAAVIGQAFELDILAELVGETPAQTFERLMPAVENSLVSDAGGRFAFAHAIVAHTLYDELTPTARGLSHTAIAIALEQRQGDGSDDRAGEIAHHWIHAVSPQRSVKAAEFAERAGNHALTHLAPDDAVTWYGQALELIAQGDSTERCNLLVGLGTAQRHAGVTAHRETLLEASRIAIDLGDDDLLVRAALANNRGEVSQIGTIDDERIKVLRAAIAARSDGPDSAMLHAILSIELQDRSDNECREMAARAIELARAAGDDRTTARVVPIAESSLLTPDTLDQREEWLHEGIAAADRIGDPLLRGRLSMAHHEIAVQRGDRDVMDRERQARNAFAQRSPEPFVRWTNEQTTTTHLFLDGDLEAAEASAETALNIAIASGQPEAFYGYAGNLFQIRRAQDRFAEVADELQQFAAENPSIQAFQAGLAYLWCELERYDEARELAVDLDLSSGTTPQYWSTTLMLWAEVCHALDLLEPAERIVSILDPWKDKVASTGGTTEGAIAHGLGRALATLGRTAEATAAYDLAVTVNRRLRAPLYVAQTQVADAELFIETDPDRAHRLVTDAQATVAGLDSGQIDRRIGHVLSRLP